MLPKVAVFDLGKVLLDFDYSIAAGKISAESQANPVEIQRFIDHSSLLFRYETGLMTSRQFYQAICDGICYRGGFEEFSGAFADIFAPIPEMIQLQGSLRKAGFPCCIFSNTNELAVAHIRQQYPFFSNFDEYVFSFEHRAMKPDEALYRVVELKTARRGPEILYIDDRPENIAAGAALGWQVVLQESPSQTLEAIKRLGLMGA